MQDKENFCQAETNSFVSINSERKKFPRKKLKEADLSPRGQRQGVQSQAVVPYPQKNILESSPSAKVTIPRPIMDKAPSKRSLRGKPCVGGLGPFFPEAQLALCGVITVDYRTKLYGMEIFHFKRIPRKKRKRIKGFSHLVPHHHLRRQSRKCQNQKTRQKRGEPKKRTIFFQRKVSSIRNQFPPAIFSVTSGENARLKAATKGTTCL